MITDGFYVVRSVRDTAGELVTYELVDGAGKLAHVTIPRVLSTDERSHEVLRAAVQRARIPARAGG